MPLYLGSEKLIITAPNMKYRLIISDVSTSDPIIDGVVLKLLEDYILKDSNGLYLTVEDGE